MIKKSFLTVSMVLLGLFAAVNTMWGQQDGDQKIYLGALQAQSSPSSTGSGQVQLTWLDITGTPMTSSIAVVVQPTNPVGPAATVQSSFATMFAMDGVETALGGNPSTQIYMTSYAYFQAEAFPDNGSYLDNWIFTDPVITRLDTIGAARGGVYFKILPDTANYAYYPSGDRFVTAATEASTHPNNIYAVFKKFILSNPVTTSGQLDATDGASTSLNVSIDVEGDVAQLKDAYADFAFPATTFSEDAEGTWTWAHAAIPTEDISATKKRYHFVVTYTAKSAITVGTHRATLTIGMQGAGASALNISLSVNALDPARPEAYWFDGKTEMTSGTLSDMLLVNISGYTNPILQLNKSCGDLSFSEKTFTLDLNGNNAGVITVTGGELTIAYNRYGGEATSLMVSGGKAILNGSTLGALTVGAGGIVEQNGAIITGVATNAGSLTTTEGQFQSGLTSSGTLTINGGAFAGATAITVSGGTAAINRGAITGTTYGVYTTGGTTTIAKLAAISGTTYSVYGNGGTVTVNCGKFGASLAGSLTFVSGYFKNTNYGVSTTGLREMQVAAGVEYNEGYRYFLGNDAAALANGVGVCRIGNVSYATLEDALAYANNNPSVENIVIFMTNDYVLPAGYYTLPANATLVVPMSDTQAKEVNKTAPRVSFHDMDRSHPYVQPTEFRRLTFAAGVNMDVFGELELTCTQFASNEAYTSQPYGPYGRLVMEAGSHMTLQAGSELRVWGFMTGAGETDARRNSKVREMFQMGDWKGAMTSVKITGMAPGFVADDSEYKIFPVSQYFIQSVESPVKYHPGAVLSTSATVAEGLGGFLAVAMTAADIKVVGISGRDEAIFLMDNEADAENTWVRKYYDAEHDIQVYEINSGAHIGSMVIDMGELDLTAMLGAKLPVKLNSANFDLPLTNNMKIHLLSGTMDFKQNTSLLPGAEVEVDKESIVSVAKNDSDPDHTGALYVYDASEWGKYAFCRVYGESDSKAYTKVVRYTPSANGTPTLRNEQTCPSDAAINVKGTFNTARGYVYTSAGGANIFSNTSDAGTFIFNQDASAAGTRTVNQVEGESTYRSQTFYSAKLKNGDATYAETSTAVAGDAYCYLDDKWTIMKVDEDDNCFMVDNYGTYYAKPSEYVALASKTENADHTYSDKAGSGRLFILVNGEEECQWWEVEQRDNLYYCAKSDMYYYYDEDDLVWTEKKFIITWRNWDGTIVQTADEDGRLRDYDIVKYGTMAEFLGTNPTREANIDYTYDFTGWQPALGPVTQDVTYTATYVEQPRKYTIIFCQEGGSEIERQFLTHNEMPVCENVPTKVGHILQWSPSIAAVTGDATYTATWLEEPPTEYAITFFDYDGTTKLKPTGEDPYMVAVGTMPVAPANPSGKPATSEFTYEFDHWSPALEIVSITSAKSYTAVYREVAQKYTVTFLNEDNSVIEANEYAYGETPVCSATPTKVNTAEFTYSFAWTPQIQTVMADATYKAKFTATTNKYTVTLVSSIAGACTFTGAGVYDYGTSATIAAIPTSGYEFVKWQEREGEANLGAQTITGDITLTAVMKVVEPTPLEITADGQVTLTTPVTHSNLIITSDGSTSGELIGANNLTLTGNAYFDLNINAQANTWYAVAVPWQVSAVNGIIVNDVPLHLGTDMDVIYYDGSVRASQGKVSACWHYLEYEGDKTMYPGTLYMMYLANPATTIRFQKKDGADILTTTLSVQAHSSANPLNAGWNGIANPALFHGFINANAETYGGVNFAQKYNPSTEHYDAIDLTQAVNKLIVGAPIFVQVAADKNNFSVYDNWSDAAAHAPRRAPIVEDAYYEVHISAGEDYTDRVYLLTKEDKEDTYVIGLDLAKAGISTKVAQMWVDRYNAQLCVNTTAPVGKTATYPLGISIPQAGTYQIYSATAMQPNQELYVTRNGNAIWNLAYGPYTITLDAGTYSEYGLKLIQSNAPTDIDQSAITNDQLPIKKVLIDNKVYIVREGELYTITGQKVQ